MSEDLYLERYEISRGWSPFNTQLYARRNFPGRLICFVGATRFEKTSEGLTSRALEPAALRAALISEIGLSEEIVARYEALPATPPA